MLRLAIIGHGFGKIGHMPAFASIRGCKVVAVDDGSNWQALLKRTDIDAVSLAVPPFVQYKIAKAALLRGLHIFAEKPLAVNLKQARELALLARSRKVVTGVDFIFPEIAEWRQVQKMVCTKALGKLNHISIEWCWLSGDIKHKRATWKTDIQKGGGLLAFYFSHGLHYLEQFAGPIADIQSSFAHSPRSLNGGEVGLDMLLQFKNGATGDVHVSCTSTGRTVHRLVFECERGTIVLEGNNTITRDFIVTQYTEQGTKVLKPKKDVHKKGEDERVASIRKLAQRFVDSCRTNKKMNPSFAEGLRVQELIEQIRRAAKK